MKDHSKICYLQLSSSQLDLRREREDYPVRRLRHLLLLEPLKERVKKQIMYKASVSEEIA